MHPVPYNPNEATQIATFICNSLISETNKINYSCFFVIFIFEDILVLERSFK